MNLKNLKPLHDRIAVEPIQQEEKTQGGIIIPDTAKEKPVQGIVVAVGSGTKHKCEKCQSSCEVSLEVKVGDKIMYGKWSGTEIEFGGKKLMIMKESDVMAIIS